MSDFDFSIDQELDEIRGQEPKRKKQVLQQKKKPKPERKNGSSSSSNNSTHVQQQMQGQPSDAVNQSTKPTQVSEPEPEGFKVEQSHQEVMSGSATTSKKKVDPINWKAFRTLPNIFEHVGGDRPVRLNPDIRKSQVSGLPEPMLGLVQSILKEKHNGAIVTFPWGDYEITEKNRVFTTKSSLIRYLLLDAFRDENGTHVQYAKQWLVLNHPVFDEGFNPETHLTPTSDELDIYALLYVSHQLNYYGEHESSRKTGVSEADHQISERISMVNMGMSRILDKITEQEKAFQAYTERSNTIETILLLDRMGLLKGGLPRDVGEFVRVLEQNRDQLKQTDTIVNNHIYAEKQREKALLRDARIRQTAKGQIKG